MSLPQKAIDMHSLLIYSSIEKRYNGRLSYLPRGKVLVL